MRDIWVCPFFVTAQYYIDFAFFFLDANFVSSFHYSDNFVYFFLRETAVEMNKVSVWACDVIIWWTGQWPLNLYIILKLRCWTGKRHVMWVQKLHSNVTQC